MIGRGLRASAAAALLAGLALPALAVGSTSAALTLPATTGVQTRVTDSDPAWVLDFSVTFGPATAPADLTALCQPGAQLVLNFAITSPGQSGTSGTVDPCLRDPSWAPNEVIVHFNMLGGSANQFTPSVVDAQGNVTLSQVGFYAKLKDVTGLSPEQYWSDPRIGAPLMAALPTAPVWIGMGDGYSSQLMQPTDGCTLPASCAGYNPNDAPNSWINKAVSDVNFQRNSGTNSNGAWNLSGVVVAHDGADTAAVAGSQSASMASVLEQHVVPRAASEGGPLSSWNWVSVSAGLVDAGIPTALNAYYAVGGNGPTQTANLPWAATAASGCPNLSGALGTIQAQAGAWRNSLTSMATQAKTVDAHVHVLQVLYPLLTEPTNPCATSATPKNGDVVTALNAAIDLRAPAPVHNLSTLDLQARFGGAPTGTPPTRSDTRLWLSRPWGYPYPNASGQSGIAHAAEALLGAAAVALDPTDITPPVIKVPATPLAVIVGSTDQYPVSATDNIDVTDPVNCTPAATNLPIGVSTVTCTSTDHAGNSSTAKFDVIVGAKLGTGTFVIGDGSAAVGTHGYFWGSQWQNSNIQSRSISHDAFKGYADYTDDAHRTWTTKPGNSSNPPDMISPYQVVIITSNAHKSGSTITGDIVGYAIVQVDTGYWKAPGHLGGGTIVASNLF